MGITTRVVYLSWCQPNVDWAAIKANHGAVLIRIGQGIWEDRLFRTHYNNAVLWQVPIVLWHFHQPDMAAEPQIDFIKSIYASLKYKPVAIGEDEEPIEWWLDGVRMPNIVPPSRDYNHANLLKILRAEKAMGLKPGIYTRKDYFEAWTNNTPEWKEYWLWVAAWYVYTGEVPPALPRPFEEYKFHQYTGGQLDVPGVIGLACHEYYNGDQSSLIAFTEPPYEQQEIEPMTTLIHNKNVPMKDRARIVTIQPHHKILVPWQELGVKAVVLPMAHMPMVDGYCKPAVIECFAGRCKDAAQHLGVIGQMELSAANWLKDGNLTDVPVKAVLKENVLVKLLLDAWHDGPWTWDKVLTKQGKWLPISALEFKEVDVFGYLNQQVDANWQNIILGTMLERVKYLMDGGFVPNIPVWLYTGPWWLSIYDKLDNAINLTLARYKDWLRLRLGQWTLYSTAEFMVLDDIFKYPPPDDFQFEFRDKAGMVIYTYPAGYFERIVGHEFSGEHQKVKTISGGEVDLTLYCDTPTKLSEDFALPPEGGGGEVPPEAAQQSAAYLRAQAAEMIRLAEVLETM